MARGIALAIALLIGWSSAGCDRGAPRVRRIDLLASIARAEKRPAADAIATAIVTLGGETQPALEVPATSRVVWTERLPERAVLMASVGVSPVLGAAGRGRAVFRIGISDERTYDELNATAVELAANGRWQRIAIDLSKYGGFKWSLFYRPRNKTWSIIFNTIVKGLGRPPTPADRLYWARPVVEQEL